MNGTLSQPRRRHLWNAHVWDTKALAFLSYNDALKNPAQMPPVVLHMLPLEMKVKKKYTAANLRFLWMVNFTDNHKRIL